MKVCSKCGQEKSEAEFSKNRRNSSGLRAECKSCQRAHYLANREATILRSCNWLKCNKEKRRHWVKKHRADNLDRLVTERKNRYHKDPEKSRENAREWGRRNRGRASARSKTWRLRHRDEVNAAKCARKQSDALFAFSLAIRGNISCAIRRSRSVKKSKTTDILGCSVQDLLAKIGPKVPGYHLDHICPIAQARTEDEVLRLNHHTNLRWILAHENISKSDNKTPEGEALCLQLLGRPWQD